MNASPPDLSPVIYLAFSNNQDAYLSLLKEEAKALFEILYPLQELNQYEIFREENVDINDLFSSFKRFRNRMEVFHYGGHADGGHLLLEGKKVQGEGIAALFRTLESEVKLVFLNGCSTMDQVDELLRGDNNVSAVIGTSVAVGDDAAIDFSRQFYTELVSGSTLKASFDVASAYLLAKYEKKSRPSVVYRDLVMEGEVQEMEMPWGLYIGEGKQEMENWRLVEVETSRNIDYSSLKSVSFEGTVSEKPDDGFEVNQYLGAPLLETIQRWDPGFEYDPTQDGPSAVLESGAFPWPILVELRRLVVESQIREVNMDRLRQLIYTYQETTRFLAYTSLAQLTGKIKKEKVHLSTSNVLLTRFLGLSESQSQAFDYLQLANDIDVIFRDHEIEPWLKEQVGALKAFDEKEELETIHLFMQQLVPLVLPDTPEPTSDLELLCQQAEYCLGKLLEEVAFLTRYNLVSVRKKDDSTFEGIVFDETSRFEIISGLDTSFVPSVRLVRDVPGTAASENPESSMAADNVLAGLDMSDFLIDNLKGETNIQDLFVFEFKSGDQLVFRQSWSKNLFELGPDDEKYVDFSLLLNIDEVRQSPKRFRYANYNSDAPDGEDHLDIMPDVRAFANLIASSDLHPPLSIGLFGDWGSGKSFFMGKLKKEVEQYEKRAKRELSKSADTFLLELDGVTEPQERQKRILSLFPDPKTQIAQIEEWIKRWEKRRDPSSLRSLGRVFGIESSDVERMLLAGELDEFTEESLLVEKLNESQQRGAKKLAKNVMQSDEHSVNLLRKLVELSTESDLGYCRNIAQIEFNAWHYIDTNLWASLVTNILEDLNTYVGNLPQEEKAEIQLFKDLATTQIMKEQVVEEISEINDEIQSITDDLTELKAKKEAAEMELKDIRFKDAITLLSKNDDNVQKIIGTIQSQGAEASKKVGLKDFEVNVENAKKQVLDLEKNVKSTWSRWSAWKETYKGFSSRTKNILILLLAVPLLAFLILPFLSMLFPFVKEFVNWITEMTGPVFAKIIPLFALFTDGVMMVKKLSGKINTALDAVDVAKSQLGKLQAMASEEHTKEIALKEEELAQRKADLEQANQRKSDFEQRVKTLKEDLAEIEAGKRLSKFIENRLLSNDYQQHLGLISLIREDFEQLTAYLHNRGFYSKVVARIQDVVVGTNAETANDPYDLEKINTIDRIVLYVDDLDRCPPDKVVQVLQAIHLILAFPLFVVVVGVDVRWISRSLIKEYGTMLALPDRKTQPLVVGDLKGQSEQSLHFQGNATPFDYLEKIFQLPFQLNTMSEGAKEFFIGKLLEADMKQAKTTFASQPKKEVIQPVGVNGNGRDTQPVDKGKGKTEKTVPDKKGIVSQVKTDDSSAQKVETLPENQVVKTPVNHRQKLEKVSLKVREINFIKAMSPILADSPRTVKRFVNVCRLIKSHANWGKSQRVLEGKITDYETMIFILALVTGIPVFTRFLFDYLKSEDDEMTFDQLTQKVKDQIEILKTDGKEILNNKNYLDRDELFEEWEAFQRVWGKDESHEHGLILLEDVNRQLIEDFCQKKLEEIRPLFKTAVRFSFRFTEY